MIADNFGRPLTGLRISVTQRCNLNCIYCHKEGEGESQLEMEPEEIARIIKIATHFGVKKVKITGGEPLIRDDIVNIIDRLAKLDGIKDLSITTNATLLKEKAKELAKAGLDRVNVSLDTLNPKIFSFITKSDFLNTVKEGIAEAIAQKMLVKINMVVMRGINDAEVSAMLEYAKNINATLQLIELLRTSSNQEFFDRYHNDMHQIEKILEIEATDVLTRRFMHNRLVYILDGVKAEIVRPMDNSEFCYHCTRMRITSDGKFKPCLMRNDNLIDFLTPMRDGATDDQLKELFGQAVMLREPFYKKPKE